MNVPRAARTGPWTWFGENSVLIVPVGEVIFFFLLQLYMCTPERERLSLRHAGWLAG